MNERTSALTTSYVVVGIDGTTDNVGALRYAVAEAAALGAVVRLVHVVPDYVPVSPMMPYTPSELTETAVRILERAATQVHEIDPDVAVDTRLEHGTRSVQLSRAAEGARLLVVGRSGGTLVQRLFLGDTATGVAARTDVPVVQVPATWQPRHRGVIVVGVKSPRYAGELLSDAFALAERTGSTLVVLHSWKLPSEYDDLIEARVDLEKWRTEATAEVEALLRDWRRAYPDVEIEIRIVHDRPGHALVGASTDADLVLIVRRQHGAPAAVHLGSTARAVLRAAECPVRVVPPTSAAPMPLTVEERGQLAR